MFENRIKHLEEAHRALDKVIEREEKTGVFEDHEITELKKKRLLLKDKIAILRHKQQFTIEYYDKGKN